MLANGFAIWKRQWADCKDTAQQPPQLQSTTASSLARAVVTTESAQSRIMNGQRAAVVDSSTEDATRVLLLCSAAKVLG